MSDSHCCCRALSRDGGLSAGIHSAECYFPSVCGERLWVRKHRGGSSIRAPLRTDLLTSLPSLAVRLLKHTSSFEYAATFTFPLFSCHGFLSPSVNEALRAPRTQSGSLAHRRESTWAAALCPDCISSWVSGLSAEVFWCEHFKGLERVWLNRLSFLAQDRVLLAINSIGSQIKKKKKKEKLLIREKCVYPNAL